MGVFWLLRGLIQALSSTQAALAAENLVAAEEQEGSWSGGQLDRKTVWSCHEFSRSGIAFYGFW